MAKENRVTNEETKRFIRDHFERLINRGDMSMIDKNVVSQGYVDHDGPGGRDIDVDQARGRMAAAFQQMKGLRVEVRDVVADGDRVVVRNVWTAADASDGHLVEMHGFVMFRMEDGKLAERWATVTDPAPVPAGGFRW